MRPSFIAGLLFYALCTPFIQAWAQAPGDALPLRGARELGFDPDGLARVETRLRSEIDSGRIAGARLMIGRRDAVVASLTLGSREIGKPEPLAASALFDLASLTKVVATTPAVLRLVEAGKIRLDDPVSRHLPGFAVGGKESITIEQLLRHRGGLVADDPLGDYASGPAEARRRLQGLVPVAAPGERYLYSDCGMMVLAFLVEAVTGKDFAAAVRELVLDPLDMRDTRFASAAADPAFEARCVPTEAIAPAGARLSGRVHDPRARALGGAAGHAGLFSTADDLAKFCASLAANDGRLLGEATVRSLGRAPAGIPEAERRGLGFDCRPASATAHRPGGRLFPEDGFGHTGFTGTSLWIDPRSGVWFVLLTSRLQVAGCDLSGLRRELGDAIARAIVLRPWSIEGDPDLAVRVGVDAIAEGYRPGPLIGRRIGLVTNQCGRDAQGRPTAEVLRSAGFELVALFSPEHGIAGRRDESVGDGRDPESGLPVFSLYGKRRSPDPASLAGIEALVVDLPDVGCRFYTYLSTLVLTLRSADTAGLPLVLLDRPNPIGGESVAGPIADPESTDFVGILPVPVVHGMTLGELLLFAHAAESRAKAVEVVPVRGWKRSMTFEKTGLAWRDPSPAMRSLEAALLYPGVGLFETTNLSVGRGTDSPFERIGAPWFPAAAVADDLGASAIPGLAVSVCDFRPASGPHAGELCRGLQLSVTDTGSFRPLDLAAALMSSLARRAGPLWTRERFDRLLKHRATIEALDAGRSGAEIRGLWDAVDGRFLARRRECLLYD